MIIDAHQHFWQLARGDYDWLTPELAPLYRDFMPEDLMPHLQRNCVDGTILVQAAPTSAETKFLLEIADNTPFVLGVVGWTDFTAPSAVDDIAELAKHPKLVGLRPMIHDIADDNWMLRDDLAPAFEMMVQANLTFDALVRPQHLSQLRELLSRYPKLRTVIDHAAKPRIADALFDDWANDIATIAKETEAFCKLSGLLTEAGKDWKATDVDLYVAHFLEHFGPERLLWGSDWPVLTLASDYDTWRELADALIPSECARAAIFSSSAIDLYRLPERQLTTS
jgi:L-fuconolactonase